MRRLVLAIALLIISTMTFAQKADDIIGKYHLPNKLDLEIYKVGQTYQGRIVALNGYENGQMVDSKNPDEEQQNQPLIGMVILKDLEWDAEEKQWVNGSMYGPEKGMVFNLKVTEIREKEIEVVGSKYLFWHTLEWQRIN
jgi:uncharacterized protein (DUF2147 family)